VGKCLIDYLLTVFSGGALSFWDEWVRRKRRGTPFFPDLERMVDEMEREMADFFKEIEDEIPEDMAQERILPDGSVRKEYGPFVYGYSVKIGPDGKPVVREFGNMKPELSSEEGRKPLSLQEAREPLVDVIDEGEQFKVIAELPGVERGDIQLFVSDRVLTINVTNPRLIRTVSLRLWSGRGRGVVWGGRSVSGSFRVPFLGTYLFCLA
jgi:HSP20 family protein